MKAAVLRFGGAGSSLSAAIAYAIQLGCIVTDGREDQSSGRIDVSVKVGRGASMAVALAALRGEFEFVDS